MISVGWGPRSRALWVTNRRSERESYWRAHRATRSPPPVAKAVREEGWKVVVLRWLSPLVPFELQNYFFGVTDFPFRQYVVATFVGIIPGTVLYVYLGIVARMAGGGRSSGPLTWVFFGAGLLATVAVAVLITRKVKTKLKAEGVGNGDDRHPNYARCGSVSHHHRSRESHGR